MSVDGDKRNEGSTRKGSGLIYWWCSRNSPFKKPSLGMAGSSAPSIKGSSLELAQSSVSGMV